MFDLNHFLFDFPVIAATETYRELSLLLGLGTFICGLMAMFSHQRVLRETFEQPLKPREIIFETRKYRRRIVVAALIASLGVMIASLRWITEARPFATLILIILSTLLTILVIALIDMYSVGLQALTRSKDPNREQLIKDYLEKRKSEHAANQDDSDD